MNDWLVGLFGEAYATAAFWTIILLAVAIVLLVFLRANRRFTSGTFISGGRNRQPRLAVTDATPVDSHRRLVLVRRDNVEHLILIGGPSDVVIESDIAIPPRELAETHVNAAHDLLTEASDPDTLAMSEQSAPADLVRPERRSAPPAYTPRVASTSTAPVSQVPNRYPSRDRGEAVQSNQQTRTREIDTPAGTAQNAMAPTRPVSAATPVGRVRDGRNGLLREEAASAADNQSRPPAKATSPAGPHETAAAQNTPAALQDPAHLESTLEDEMSRLLEEISEQKH